MWGFLWESRGEDSCHRGEALPPDVYIGNQNAARLLRVAAGAIRLYLPGFGQEFPNDHVLLRNDFLYESQGGVPGPPRTRLCRSR